ncbi:hypothetical protein [Syntrophotalea acetylenica]|uniref:hypothetical protein n=1 Tax=Syntrophotalea acetylenica TaxID=29542 RepID=UPI002A3656EE|nr:hypothetical protein [Syntrophotalea acetylenica]MDY0263514.1 hypothetical protein [Syntrophotalea acetylenica]
MDKSTRGAWIIHHGRKISSNVNGAAEYCTIDIAAKSASLLARMAESSETVLDAETVNVLARVGGLNPKTELSACLGQLESQKVIEISADGSVAVLGVTTRSALVHASDLFDKNSPESFEKASLDLGERVSVSPISLKVVAEYIGDTHKLTKSDTSDFLSQATELGFVDVDGDKEDPLLFNGNLFRRDTVNKTKKVMDSLSPQEQRALQDFDGQLKSKGAVHIGRAEEILGIILLSKLRAAAVFDENIVSNEAGDHSFITSPGAFHKFTDPLQDDAFDHAKSLVSALCYGMHMSSPVRGNIWGVNLILEKLIRGGTVGPVQAIGKDYRALELERVVQIIPGALGYSMRLLKREVGEIALQVLQSGGGPETAMIFMPGAQVTGYTGPEAARISFKKKKELQPSRKQMRTLLSSVRSGGGL